MRLEGNTLYLSRRNLNSLLAKLDGHPPNSACTIGHPDDMDFWVTAEEDGIHYGHPSRAEFNGIGVVGPMHPETELALQC